MLTIVPVVRPDLPYASWMPTSEGLVIYARWTTEFLLLTGGEAALAIRCRN